MNGAIHVEESALAELKDALNGAGEDYKANLAKLTNLIEQITSGNIQGPVAQDLLEKYEAKRELFNMVQQTIDEAKDYAGKQETTFINTMSDVISRMN